MSERRIKTKKELDEQIARLTARKTVLEKELTATAEDLYDNLRHPSRIIRSCVNELADDSQFRLNLFKLATGGFARFFSRRKEQEQKSKMVRVIGEIVDFIIGRLDKKKEK